MKARTLPSGALWIRWVVFFGALAGLTTLLTGIAFACTPEQRNISIVVVPHPDDEFQTWSLIENRPDEFTVFALMTQGEESGYCEPEILETSLQADQGEVSPSPVPGGRWSRSCEEARQHSLIGYLTQMAESDGSIPGDFATVPERYGPLPADDTEVCRVDDGAERCDETIRSVDVWLDRQNRGAVVFFDLGDGDLTSDETAWALRSVIGHGQEWGFPDQRVAAMIGAFANDGEPCYRYPHPDHVTVHETLYSVDFGVGPQLGATCFLDEDQRMSAFVSADAVAAAFTLDADGARVGAHPRHYGWLHAATYPLADARQNQLFMSFQTFWVRFN